MTSNIKLKQECKATLNSIRELLPQQDRQNIEPLLRRILDLTKGLVENAKVSPEEHEALASQVGTLTKERARLSNTIDALRRDLEKASTLKDALAALESEKNHLNDLLTDVIFDSLHRCAANGIGLIAKCGDSEVAEWIAEKTASNELDAIERRALLALCLMVTSVVPSDETVSQMLAHICSIPKPNGSTRWMTSMSSCFKPTGQSGASEDSEDDEWWWLAVNGGSYAACFVQARAADLEVAPVPEQLIGFRTREKQLEIQQFLLTAPMDDVQQYMASLPAKIKSGEVACVRPRNPEPPTHGSTSWHLRRHKAV
jgi:hypothetical protein